MNFQKRCLSVGMISLLALSVAVSGCSKKSSSKKDSSEQSQTDKDGKKGKKGKKNLPVRPSANKKLDNKKKRVGKSKKAKQQVVPNKLPKQDNDTTTTTRRASNDKKVDDRFVDYKPQNMGRIADQPQNRKVIADHRVDQEDDFHSDIGERNLNRPKAKQNGPTVIVPLPRKKPKNFMKNHDHNVVQRPLRKMKSSGSVRVLYYDNLGSLKDEADRLLRSASMRNSVLMAQKNRGRRAAFQRVSDYSGQKYSDRLVAEVYNSHGCFLKEEGACLVIENGRMSPMGVRLASGKSTQILSGKVDNRGRDAQKILAKYGNQRIVISRYSHSGVNAQGAQMSKSQKQRHGVANAPAYCGISGTLNAATTGVIVIGGTEVTTEETANAPVQMARISCINIFTGERRKPIRVLMELSGPWIGGKLQFDAWFNGSFTSYDTWKFGATGIGFIPDPLALVTPIGSYYLLIDANVDLLVGSFTPIGTGIFARKNTGKGPSFVIPFYLKSENGAFNLGAQLEILTMRMTVHPDEF